VILQLPTRQLDLRTPVVMGVLNLTPDSFSDGGRYNEMTAALARARTMLEEGAAIIDIGGESTRPGAAAVSAQEELDRVIPVIEHLRKTRDCVISIDTMKPEVMAAACVAGAELINDVNALQADGALAVARAHGAAVCVMHMQGVPQTMQAAPQYRDVVGEVRDFLVARVAACVAAGIDRDSIVIDPGFGFGKSLAHNLFLFKQIHAFEDLALPILVGVSRKSMLGQVLNLPVERRLNAGLAAAALAVNQGARIIRTHDVLATVEAVKFAAAVRQATA
jgi:dihydropteroate synthase